MFDQMFVTVKYAFMFTFKYFKYVYYGLKQRLRAVFCLELGLFGFLKSLLRLPIECYHFTCMEFEYGK